MIPALQIITGAVKFEGVWQSIASPSIPLKSARNDYRSLRKLLLVLYISVCVCGYVYVSVCVCVVD